jgi:hypothetical protein
MQLKTQVQVFQASTKVVVQLLSNGNFEAFILIVLVVLFVLTVEHRFSFQLFIHKHARIKHKNDRIN